MRAEDEIKIKSFARQPAKSAVRCALFSSNKESADALSACGVEFSDASQSGLDGMDVLVVARDCLDDNFFNFASENSLARARQLREALSACPRAKARAVKARRPQSCRDIFAKRFPYIPSASPRALGRGLIELERRRHACAVKANSRNFSRARKQCTKPVLALEKLKHGICVPDTQTRAWEL